MNNLSGWLKRNVKKFRLDRESNLDLCDDRTQGHCGFNRLGCSFYCEDHVQFHIFIRSSNHFIYFNTRIFLYQLLFSLVISSFVFKNLLLFVLSATSESVDGMVKALWTFRRTQASLSFKESKSALQVKCSLNRHVTFSLASHPKRDPPL